MWEEESDDGVVGVEDEVYFTESGHHALFCVVEYGAEVDVMEVVVDGVVYCCNDEVFVAVVGGAAVAVKGAVQHAEACACFDKGMVAQYVVVHACDEVGKSRRIMLACLHCHGLEVILKGGEDDAVFDCSFETTSDSLKGFGVYCAMNPFYLAAFVFEFLDLAFDVAVLCDEVVD